jgi:hypothetical protein
MRVFLGLKSNGFVAAARRDIPNGPSKNALAQLAILSVGFLSLLREYNHFFKKKI